VKWWSFEERGNWSTRRKPLGAEKKTNKLNPHMTPDLGIEPGPHWWEASALTTLPSLHLVDTIITGFTSNSKGRPEKFSSRQNFNLDL